MPYRVCGLFGAGVRFGRRLNLTLWLELWLSKFMMKFTEVELVNSLSESLCRWHVGLPLIKWSSVVCSVSFCSDGSCSMNSLVNPNRRLSRLQQAIFFSHNAHTVERRPRHCIWKSYLHTASIGILWPQKQCNYLLRQPNQKRVRLFQSRIKYLADTAAIAFVVCQLPLR